MVERLCDWVFASFWLILAAPLILVIFEFQSARRE